MSRGGFNRTIDFTGLEAPPELDDSARKTLDASSEKVEVSVIEKKFQIHIEKVTKRDSKPQLDVLFLHGGSFSSQNWLEIETLYHVANWGHRAVAVDIPGGKGQSTGLLLPENRGEFLKCLIATLGLDRPVIVSPSLFGGYSLPFLFEDGETSLERARGFVPVAPVGTAEFVEQYKKSQIPTLVVCGTEDQRLGPASSRDLQHLPSAQYAPIEGARHACYMNNPDAFHKLLHSFLGHLKSDSYLKTSKESRFENFKKKIFKNLK